MPFLKKLFGGSGSSSASEPELYEGFKIYAEPVIEDGSFRLTARIEKEIDGEVRSHMLIRADTFQNAETAAEAAVTKAKMMIDQMGDRLLDSKPFT